VSSFLGKQISDLLNHLEATEEDELINLSGKHGMKLDIPSIPEIMVDNTDRNRTSPFAFTGNRFEFRAVGAGANCASAMIALNTAMAEALVNFKKRVDALIAKGENQGTAILKILRHDIKACKNIRFDGNGYSKEWEIEAAKRGLDVEKSCPVIFDRYLDPESIEMFESMNVMTEMELKARNEIKWETYTKTIQIEARIFGDMAINHIIPIATRYQSSLTDNVHKLREIFGEEAMELSDENIKLIREISMRTKNITSKVQKMIDARKIANKIECQREKAIAYHDTVAPFLEEIRYDIDKLEMVIDDEIWPLPKYRELLFIR
jgi:glutamine synthetase